MEYYYKCPRCAAVFPKSELERTTATPPNIECPACKIITWGQEWTEAAKPPEELTGAQQHFCELICLEGMGLGEAWIKAGNKCDNTNIAQKSASRFKKTPAAVAYIKELTEIRLHNAIASKDELERFLTQAIFTPAGDLTKDHPVCESYETDGGKVKVKGVSKHRAIEQLAKLRGYYAPEQVAVSGLDDIVKLMSEIRSQA